MTIEEFLTIKIDQWIYNKEKRIICQANSSFYLTPEQRTAVELVKDRLSDNPQSYLLGTRNVFTTYGRQRYGNSIDLYDREEWIQVYSIINDVDDQKLINRVLHHQIQLLNDYVKMELIPKMGSMARNFESLKVPPVISPVLETITPPSINDIDKYEI